jgi:hypothetical protein
MLIRKLSRIRFELLHDADRLKLDTTSAEIYLRDACEALENVCEALNK